jgi:seryl-tRNA synthetase
MLQIQYLREHTQEAISRLKKRNIDAETAVNKALELDEVRRKTQQESDRLLAESNAASKEIGVLMQTGKKEEAEKVKASIAHIKDSIKKLEEAQAQAEFELTQHLYTLPNAPYHLVPEGKGADDNLEIKQVGTIPDLGDHKLPHWELTTKYNLIDFELGVKITGAGFPVYKGKAARLQRALINFFLDINTQAGYQEYQVPHVVNEASGYGTGQLPDKEGQMYHVGVDDLYLIPTAEVPLTNLFRDEIVRGEDLPIKLTGYTPCFRREAGSYGKDVRGLNRLHQFDKVEIVQIQHPEKSYAALEDMVTHVAGILEKLGLPYRILRLCGGDMGFASAMTYDFEVYSTAQERWLEVSSVSNFETFQSNRLKLRYREGSEKPVLAHTLNGSALALPRIMAGILENYQTADGITIPEVLVPYCGFDKIS